MAAPSSRGNERSPPRNLIVSTALPLLTAPPLPRPRSTAVAAAASSRASAADSTVENRAAEMISPVPDLILDRNCFFLTPVDHSTPPEISPLLRGAGAVDHSVRPDFQVLYPGWKPLAKNWQAWTDRMLTLHGPVWRQAGILNPILNSCSTIHRDNRLISDFAEKWSSSTNTFVFPWGEATVTLEDMMVIGGYSVLGDPVFSSVDRIKADRVDVRKQLELERKMLNRRTHKVLQTQWLERFMDTGSPFEHEAYLTMWLSRFVFPVHSKSHDTIGRHVLDLAVLLASGTRVALAPAVLSSVYSSLGRIKDAMNKNFAEISVSAPLQHLQIWIWERFPGLRPDPAIQNMDPGQPWFLRWRGLKNKCPNNVRQLIDEAGGTFIFRPFYVVLPERYYTRMSRMVNIGSVEDPDTESLIRTLRHSELVGMDHGCIMQYLPHRVARQFGYDQDVPAPVPRFDSDRVQAWGNYSRAVADVRLYVPPDIYQTGISTRYRTWWNGYVPSGGDVSSFPRLREALRGLHMDPPPPGFPIKRKRDPPVGANQEEHGEFGV